MERDGRGDAHRRRSVPLSLVPVTHAQANDYVQMIHRHNGRLPTSIIHVGVADEAGMVRGVAVAGLPKARLLCDGYTIEVSRVCTDGAYNACSMLYAACIKAARALGYRRIVTYTIDAEAGTSLKASGWKIARASRGGTWKRPNQTARRGQIDAHDLGAKWRWEITFSGESPALQWPLAVENPQMPLFGIGEHVA